MALVGADYGWNLLADPSLITTTNAVLIDFWKQGGLVTMSFHTGNPFVENGTAKTLTQHPLSDLTTPGTEANGRWMQTLAKVADGLEELKNAGVVVLWRPFHEANGGWFWWAHPKHKNGWTPAGEFVALWRHMFAYFVQERDLDNLLWVYNANYRSSPGLLPVDYYYPGAAYVDLVSLDIYADTLYPAPAAQRGCEDLRAFDKPIALAEVGPATFSGEFDAFQVIKFIQDFCPETTYFLFWNSWESTGFSGPVRHKAALIDQRNYRQLLNHPWVITLDEIDRGD